MRYGKLILFLLLSLSPLICAGAELSLPALTIEDGSGESASVSVSLQMLAIMTALTLLPAFLLTMTSFTRVIIVLAILRQAIGMPQTPSNQILIGLSLFLTLFIMGPTISKVHQEALTPYLNDKITIEQAIAKAEQPIKTFMLDQTRTVDLALFSGLSGHTDTLPNNLTTLSLLEIMPAFITSELKTAFQIGFLIFIPFLIIDLVVASVLMSMGMMMLSPLIISLPFKIMLFVLVDGWALITGTLAHSFMQ